jgi:threonine/homoserine/homoserine lactone efflux protein
MMHFAELAFALLALLATPGPTNTLLALAGTERGLLHAMRLITAVVAAYLLVTVPLALGGVEFIEAAPLLRPVITLAAAVWVAILA